MLFNKIEPPIFFIISGQVVHNSYFSFYQLCIIYFLINYLYHSCLMYLTNISARRFHAIQQNRTTHIVVRRPMFCELVLFA